MKMIATSIQVGRIHIRWKDSSTVSETLDGDPSKDF